MKRLNCTFGRLFHIHFLRLLCHYGYSRKHRKVTLIQLCTKINKHFLIMAVMSHFWTSMPPVPGLNTYVTFRKYYTIAFNLIKL